MTSLANIIETKIGKQEDNERKATVESREAPPTSSFPDFSEPP